MYNFVKERGVVCFCEGRLLNEKREKKGIVDVGGILWEKEKKMKKGFGKNGKGFCLEMFLG